MCVIKRKVSWHPVIAMGYLAVCVDAVADDGASDAQGVVFAQPGFLYEPVVYVAAMECFFVFNSTLSLAISIGGAEEHIAKPIEPILKNSLNGRVISEIVFPYVLYAISVFIEITLTAQAQWRRMFKP